MSRQSPAWLLAAACCLSAPAALPQDRAGIVERRLQQAFASFDAPQHSGVGADELVRLGALAVPAIVRRLGDAATPTRQRLQLLAVLAAIEPPPLAALPACCVWLGDPGLRDTAAAAVVAIGVFAEPQQRQELAAKLAAVMGRGPRGGDYLRRLDWGTAMPFDEVRAAIAGERTQQMAVFACEAIASGCAPCTAPQRHELRALLQARLPGVMPPGGGGTPLAVAMTSALRRLGAVEDAAMRRAMLWHPSCAERLRAVLWPGDGEGDAEVRRLDLEGRLFDGDSSVAIAAARQLLRLGAAGRPALGRLLQLADAGGELGPVGREVAAAMFAAWAAGADAATAAAIADLQRFCCDDTPLPAGALRGAAAAATVAQLVRWLGHAPERTASLMRAAGEGGLRSRELVDAALAVLRGPDASVSEAALALLAAQGRGAATALGAESPLLALLRQRSSRLRDAHECQAWIAAGADASTADLRAALAAGDARVALRAVAELIGRGEAAAPAQRLALQQLAARTPATSWQTSLRPVETDLWERTRALAALQVAVAEGAAFVTADADLRELVASVLVVAVDDLPAELQRLQREGLAATARAIEAAGRDRLMPAAGIGPPR